jgi:pimeloyl-ACP methyl ester carboxylesterase
MMNAAIEHRQLQRSGCAIHYFVSGQAGQPLIIFLHPAFADHRAFDYQLDYFAPHYRIVTLDLLGHGLSRCTDGQDKLDASADHLRAIMDSEGYQRAHFVGVSLGSLIAQYAALLYPERAASVTVVGGYPINGDNQAVQKAQRGEMLKWLPRALLSMNSFRRYVARGTALKPAEQDRFYEMAQGFHLRSFQALQGLGKILQHRPAASRPCPLLILCGDHDLPIAQHAARDWHAADPGTELIFINDAGHCANLDQPEAFNAALAAFLARAS